MRKCWAIIKDLNVKVCPEILQEFCEIAFDADLLESYQYFLNQEEDLTEVSTTILEFNKELAAEVYEHGNKFWLILRSFFN